MTVRSSGQSVPLLCLTWKERLTEEAWVECFRDDFDDADIAAEWTKHKTDANRTIVEAGGLLTISISPFGTLAHWNHSYNEAPKLYKTVSDICPNFPYEIITKLTTLPDFGTDSFAGILISMTPTKRWISFERGNTEPSAGETITRSGGGDDVGLYNSVIVTGGAWATNDAVGYILLDAAEGQFQDNFWYDGSVSGNAIFVGRHYTGALREGIYFGMIGGTPDRLQLRHSHEGFWDKNGDNTLPVWLKIIISAAGNMTFWYSTDGTSYTQYTDGGAPLTLSTTLLGTSSLLSGLMCLNTPGNLNATTATFEYFLQQEWGAVGDWATSEECLSFKDIRAPTRHYAGRLKSLSPLKRALDDRTGLYQVADLSAVLANNDRYYSQRVADGMLKNQDVNLYHAWTEEPDASRTLVMRMFVEDYKLKGPEFHVKMKDVTQKYFSKKIPENICTAADYPNIHLDHEGRFMPEVLGECVVGATYDRPGAVEAVYVNTAGPPYIHLASRGELNDVTAVYDADGAVIAPVNWTFVAGPPSTISVNHASGDGTIYFNCEGYSVPAWDSANGYVQNLVRIIEYLLYNLMDMPGELIDSASFDDLADYFDDQGWGTSGFLILQKRQDAMEVLRQLLFTGGIKGYVALGGRFTVDIKDVHNYEITSTDSYIFTQTDLLEAPERQWNLTKAINTVSARYGYIPWQQLWIGAGSDYKENFMDAVMEDRIAMHEEALPV